jgi:hypothetical protein
MTYAQNTSNINISGNRTISSQNEMSTYKPYNTTSNTTISQLVYLPPNNNSMTQVVNVQTPTNTNNNSTPVIVQIYIGNSSLYPPQFKSNADSLHIYNMLYCFFIIICSGIVL